MVTDVAGDEAGSAAAGRVAAYFQERQPAFVAFLKDLARLESPSLEPATLEPVFRLLADALHDVQYRVVHFPGRKTGGFLYARPDRRSRDRPYQLLLGHCDTVWPVGTLAQMPVVVEDGLLKGPGTFDMKGGVAQIVFALQALRDLGLEPSVTPVALFTSDEEIGSFESRPAIERLAKAADRALVLEPALGTTGKIKTARKGSGDFEIVVRGKPAHAGLAPEEGASAILELTYVVQHLFALNDAASGVSVNVGTLDGGIRTNIVAPVSRITVDVRAPTAADATRIDAAIRSLKPTVPGVALEIAGGIDRPPMERTPRNQVLWNQYRVLGDHLGISLEEGISGGASDGNFTSLYTATLDGLGPVGDGAHAYHEHIDIERTLERCCLLTLLLLVPPLPTLPSP